MDDLRLARDGAVLRATLARPARHNALTPAMMDALTALARDLTRDTATRVLVIDAEGPTFCAGADLGWMRAQAEADAAGRAAEAQRLAGMLAALDALPQAVIAAVQGPAWGGGLGLLAVTDVAVAADDARFGLSETRLGLLPATIGPYLVRRLGPGALRALAPTARPFGAAEAQRLGLVARCVPGADLAAAVAEEVAQALLCAPGAVAETKRLLAALGGGVTGEMVETSVAALIARWSTAEAADGAAAFLARRPPPWA